MKNLKTINGKLLAMLLIMFSIAFVQSCKDKDDDPVPVDKTALLAKIADAKALIATTEEGTAVGQYVVGSKKTLQDVINIAQAVSDNTTSTQTEVDNSVTAVTAAMTAYEGQIISPVAPDALFGYWTFDDGTGTTATDDSGNEFNGTFGSQAGLPAGDDVTTGTEPTWTTDRFGVAGKAIAFDDGAKITVPYNIKLNPAQLTIALWVNADVIYANNRFLGLQSWIGYKFQLQDANKPFFTGATDEGADGTIYDNDATVGIGVANWYHLAVTFGGGEMVFYINGVKTVAWDTPGDLVTVTGHDLVFGVGSSKYAATAANYGDDTHADYHVIPLAWGGYFRGSLDEIRMYNTVLTASQIVTLYSTEKPQ